WEHRRVLGHLAGYVVVRRVGKKGDGALYHRAHYVGCRDRGKDVFVMVDPERGGWGFAGVQGRAVRGQPAAGLQGERIVNGTVRTGGGGGGVPAGERASAGGPGDREAAGGKT